MTKTHVCFKIMYVLLCLFYISKRLPWFNRYNLLLKAGHQQPSNITMSEINSDKR